MKLTLNALNNDYFFQKIQSCIPFHSLGQTGWPLFFLFSVHILYCVNIYGQYWNPKYQAVSQGIKCQTFSTTATEVSTSLVSLSHLI